MPASKIIQDANEIVADLREWAAEFGHDRDPYVSSLATSLENGSNLNYWASVEPLEYLPNTDSVKAIPALRFARLLAGIRNVVIFFPVALTWAAVAEATTGFNSFAKANNGTPANFLLFWQNGYGYLDSFWRIGNIAQLDFLLVAVVIVFSTLVSVLQARGLKQATALQARFSRHRRLLGLQIKSYLFSFKEVPAVEVPADVLASVHVLRQAVSESLNNLQALKVTASTLNEFVPTLTDLGEKLVAASESTQLSVAGILKETSENVANVLNSTTKSVNTVLDDMEATSASIKSNARGVQDQLESLQRSLARKK